MFTASPAAVSNIINKTFFATRFARRRNEKRNFAYCIASAMNYLHQLKRPILHRDLKTMNVLLTEWRNVKISDFGESRILRAPGQEVRRSWRKRNVAAAGPASVSNSVQQ